MRLWSIHPRYLDAKGLTALWREALLARKVLAGKTRGYKHHPQLLRFKQECNPVAAIDMYLKGIYEEACKRGYSFDENKIVKRRTKIKIRVTTGQMRYEYEHLLKKLFLRKKNKFLEVRKVQKVRPHPLFFVRRGDVEPWEKRT